ncbi:MAG: DUF4080 domain-containing protein [Alphaproteobacteria bacterium]
MNLKKIVLVAANARYSHTSFGLRWLYANLGEFQNISEIFEFDINRKVEDVVFKILDKKPDIVGFGVYIWNVTLLTNIVKLLKQKSPQTIVVLGGPEISFEYDKTEVTSFADYIILGEGEKAFYDIVNSFSQGNPISSKIINGGYLDVNTLKTPYHLYSDDDIKHRVIYVESSRGCPFSCEFCLSSLTKGVRKFEVDTFLNDMDILIKRGVKHFKFVDRTFNFEKERVFKILDFFLERFKEGMQLHFEIVPDLLKKEVLEKIKEFPLQGLHLEAGIQSLNQEVLKSISRRQDNEKALANIKYIVEETGALVHADLVAGLPYEDFESFAKGFDLLFAAKPHHIQVGILKKLKGAPISRHQESCELEFSNKEPYEIIKNHTMTETEINKIKKFARFFDIYCNSEKFPNSMPLVWENEASAFYALNNFFNFVYNKFQRDYSLELFDRAEALFEYLTVNKKVLKSVAKETIAGDFYSVRGRKDKLSFM